MKQFLPSLKSVWFGWCLVFLSMAGGARGADDDVVCFVTGDLNGDYVSVTVDGEYKLSGFVKTSPILGVALSFSVPDRGEAHKIEVTVGYDPDLKTTLMWNYDPLKGPYLFFDFQGKGQLSASQSKVAPVFK